MTTPAATAVTIDVDAEHRVDGLWLCPNDARAVYVLAHGAGAGMQHPAMSSVAADLATLDIATLRFQFPYMQRRSKRPDPPPLCHATVRAAVHAASVLAGALPLFAGGRSFGGRMTSQAQALSPLPNVRGLVFLSFPLHTAKQPAMERALHLEGVRIPMLFVQGTRDELAERACMEAALARLGSRTAVLWLDGADHSWHVPTRSGRKDADVRHTGLRAVADWIEALTGS